METTIDKKTFKLTYGQAITILIFVISATSGFYAYKNSNDSKIEHVETKLESFENSVNNKFDIVNLTQTNQYRSTKNDRKRDSADNANNFKKIAEDVQEMKQMIYRMSPYNQKPISSK
ncbi:hypothetical protein [Flavobacterium sp.]